MANPEGWREQMKTGECLHIPEGRAITALETMIYPMGRARDVVEGDGYIVVLIRVLPRF
jgi:hypothetical protein